jgi:hypothetical protein
MAESLAIVIGPRADPDEVLFVALIELVVRGGLRVMPAPRGGTDGYALAPGDATTVSARPLVALLDVVIEARETAPEVGLEYAPTRHVNQRFAVRWGSVETYVRVEVWSGLQDLGLLAPRRRAFGSAEWRLTAEGKGERDRLRASLSAIKEWRQQPATSLLHVCGLPVPSGEIFDTVGAIEDSLIPRYNVDVSDALHSSG